MRKFLNNQRKYLFLYTPFIMAFGAALYFSLGTEPHIPALYLLTFIIAVAILCIKMPLGLRGVLLFAFGFCYANAFTYALNTPQLSHDIHDTKINATVADIDFTSDKTRLVLHIPSDDIGTTGRTITTVRVSAADTEITPNVGDTISATASLFRPGGADAPETFDMARWSYFNGISATGFVNDISVTQTTNTTRINSLRAYLHNRTNSILADGLVLGYKNVISASDRQIWSNAGLGHIWAISGFHMGLIGAWLFAIFFTICRLISPITKRVSARSVAICAAGIGLFGYLMLSGGGTSTVRAFLMTILAGIAFMLGRNVISLRNVCLVFIMIFIFNPYCVMQAGFQMSFAAVFGLVWLWQDVCPRMPHNKLLRIIYGAVLTSGVATLFTAPFIAIHFNSLPVYGLIGNLVLLPVFSLVIMPLVLIGVLCACAGIMLPIHIADTVYNFCRNIAEFIASLPGATISIGFIPNTAIIILILGMIAVICMRPVYHWCQYTICALCIACTIIYTYALPTPLFMTTADNELVGFIHNKQLTFNKSRAANHKFAFDTWRTICHIPPTDINVREPHNKGLYKYSTKNFNLVYIQKFVPLQDNIVSLCRDDNIDYIVSYFKIYAPQCKQKILHGGLVIYPSGYVRRVPHNRRWHHTVH